MSESDTLVSVGSRTARLNGPDIVTGRTRYADDIHLPGMLHGRILRSPHAHARIKKIDVSRALELDGVVDIVTARDIKGYSLLAKKEVCYEGEKVAIVVAEDSDIADDALQLIDAQYTVLPAVSDPLDGMQPDAPEARIGGSCEDVSAPDGRPYRNVGAHSSLIDGDTDKAFADPDVVVVEHEYRTPVWHQAYMEPNSTTARVEPDGRLTVWTSCQGSFNIRDAVAGALKIPQGNVRCIPLEMGGGFGAKNGVFAEPHAALMALRTQRPVKILMDREEEFRDGRPAPGCWARLKTAARKDGTLVAVEGRIAWDGGVSGRSGAVNRLVGPYKFPNVKLEAFGIRTNKPAPGAFRAPGAPQMAFVRECNLDALAHKLGMDPVELRLKNGVGIGDRDPNGAPITHDWLKNTLKAAAKTSEWGKKLKKNQGVGVALGDWRNASGASNAFITIAGDGSVTVLTGQVDITGVHTAMAQIVAEELGISVSKVHVILGDTDKVPYTSLSAGSKAAYSAGTAAKNAALEARKRVLSLASEALEAAEEDIVLADDEARVAGSPERSVPIAQLAKEANNSNEGPIAGQFVFGRLPTYPAYSVNVATVEVDTDTGKVRLIDLVAAQDVGKALNPMLVEGQVEGGAVQSVAYGLMEGYRYNAAGGVWNPNLLDYAIPTSLDMPPIKTVLTEEGCAHGPYGAKGVGEPPIIPGAAAIANAVFDAVGVRITEIPLTPERVRAALAEKEARS